MVDAGRAGPVSVTAMREARALREAFQSDTPLPGMWVISDFLAPQWLACARQAVADCTFAPHEARHPNGTDLLTRHQRAVNCPPSRLTLRHALSSPQALNQLAELTGIDLHVYGDPSGRFEDDVLTRWDAGSFLGPHTDHGARLVISLSLTEAWHPEYGGMTRWAWDGAGREVVIAPRMNCCVLFAPHEGSVHWVEEIAQGAPDAARFTWTSYYQ